MAGSARLGLRLAQTRRRQRPGKGGDLAEAVAGDG